MAHLKLLSNTFVANHVGTCGLILRVHDESERFGSTRKQRSKWRVDRLRFASHIRGPELRSEMKHIKGDPFPDEPLLDGNRQRYIARNICIADYPNRWEWIHTAFKLYMWEIVKGDNVYFPIGDPHSGGLPRMILLRRPPVRTEEQQKLLIRLDIVFLKTTLRLVNAAAAVFFEDINDEEHLQYMRNLLSLQNDMRELARDSAEHISIEQSKEMVRRYIDRRVEAYYEHVHPGGTPGIQPEGRLNLG